MQATLTKEFKFEAAHQLLNHNGKCRRLHGHSYRVFVEVKGEIKPQDGLSDEGMVVDFSVVKEAWDSIVGDLDHQNLNETIGPEVGPTTAENIAKWVLMQLPFASAVTVFETATSSARVEQDG